MPPARSRAAGSRAHTTRRKRPTRVFISPPVSSRILLTTTGLPRSGRSCRGDISSVFERSIPTSRRSYPRLRPDSKANIGALGVPLKIVRCRKCPAISPPWHRIARHSRQRDPATHARKPQGLQLTTPVDGFGCDSCAALSVCPQPPARSRTVKNP